MSEIPAPDAYAAQKAGKWQLWRDTLRDGLEAIAHDVFDMVRWITTIGVARLLWIDTGRVVFAVLFWILALTLLGFLMARFLLRTEIAIYPNANTGWKVFANFALNFLICFVAFVLTLWFVELLVSAFAERPKI